MTFSKRIQNGMEWSDLKAEQVLETRENSLYAIENYSS
jgi:hypothetical protein